ncbi:outer membrane protein transport protein [Thalassotalea sp. LPB0316]|uniref:outer membrane protein transport protein n=1 Tax=Thalassotalea sp. LPB0316 TaxID=2769490 RepID=UPI001866B8DA|nr:outer membrane protein transport protein [Thalassotalea sp. LPB0316]QOL26856.1 outer membrane protein transport protein [Thalassotalea sp. LPB0316]
MKLQKTLLATSILLASINAHSAAFQLNETSASGLGRAFAGEAAIADNASVVSRNPALMSQFDSAQLSVVATYVDPGVDVKGVDAPDILGPDFDVSQMDFNGVVPPAVIPAIYYVNPVNEKFVWGLGVNSNFGLASVYDNDYVAGSIGGTTDLLTLNANLSGSYKINEKFSVGLGVNVIYGQAELIRHAGAVLENGITHPMLGQLVPPVPRETELIRMEGDDVSFGWNIGATYDIDENNRLGFNYRSATEIDFDGEYTGVDGVTQAGHLVIDLPEVFEFSGYHKISDKTAFHYSAMYTGWSSFETLEAYIYADPSSPVFTKEENFNNTMRYAIGVTHEYSPALTLRAGLAYDESASTAHPSISIPDSDRKWLTAGATYKLKTKGMIDFALAFVDGDKVNLKEEDALLEQVAGQLPPSLAPVLGNTQWQYTSEGNAILVAVQYNVTF